jgi:peptide/nickel transport system permease protein
MAGSTLASATAEAARADPTTGITPPGAAPDPTGQPTAHRAQGVSPWAEAWRRFRRHKLAVISLVVLALMVLLVLFGPSLWKVAINDIDFSARLQTPSMAHPLGTDDLGQDLFARMLYGGRISLAVGFAAMMMSILVGVMIGATAGISRGSVDAALMWLTDLFLSLPQLPFLLLVSFLFREQLKNLLGPEAGVFILIVGVIGAFRWMPVARLVRAQFFSLREKEFVEAARAQGSNNRRIMVKEVLPNIVAPIIVYTTLIIPSNILFEATLSFLGIGVPPTTPSWGGQISDATSIFQVAPWTMIFPGLFLFGTTIAFNLVGDGMRDALDPKSAGYSYKDKESKGRKRKKGAGLEDQTSAEGFDGDQTLKGGS